MRKLSNVVIMTILVTGLCLAFLSTCVVEDDTPSPGTFSEEPGLALVSGSASITYTLTPSDPAADDYDLWYRAGNFTTAADIKDGGTWVRGRLSGNTTIAGLINGQMYSVVVTANKSGYNSSDSRVRRATPNLATFTTAPALALSFGNSSIGYTWTASDPAADNYTVYWRQGAYTNAADVKDGIAITNAASGGVITGLANGQPYSVVVTANKAGSQSIDSEVIQATPNMGTFTTMPALALTSGINKITYTWNASDPAADSYTVYWRQGVYTNAADVKDGIAITNAASGGEITSLTNGQFYSVVVTAAKTDYTPGDSVVMQTMPNAGTFTAAPGQPTLTAGPGTLACTWSASSPAAATYDIYYVSGNTTSVAAIKAGTHIANVTSPYTITGLTGGQQYSVLITAHSAGYNSSDSTPRTGTPNLMNFTAAPGQPTLTAGIGTLACTWSASSPAAAAYDIYYVSGNTTSVAAIKAGTRIQGVTSPYTITGLAGGQQYSVLVTALSAGYNSSDSTPRTGTPNLMNITTAPTLALTAGDGNIAYTITASIPAADNYVIYYRQGNYTTAADVKAGTAINNAVLGGSITGLTNSQMYSVIVTANLAGYNASDSAIRTATPVAPSLPASTVDRAYARGATAYSAAMSPHNGESFVRNPYDGLNTSVCQLDGGAGTKWFVVDLGAAGPIGTVRIVWGRGAGNSLDPILNYNIAVATTLANTNAATLSGTAGWMNVASSNKAAKNDAIDTDVITIPAGATGRYVRIMRQSGFTAANGEFTDWPRLAMLEVYEGGLPAAPWQRITTGSVNNVTAPARDGAPPTIGSSFTATGGFTATLTGISPAVTGAFAASTIYTYTFTLTPNQSYRFAQNGAGESQANISVGGTAATSATYHVSTTATNGTMTITREFPRTAPPEGVDQIFEAAPVLTLSSGNGSLGYSWTASNPVADNYTLYYRQGNFNAAQVISGGTAINNATSGGTISSLTNGQVYSVVVRANRTGYTSIESAVRTETPAVRRSNFKRGVGYNFVALRAPGNIPANQSNTHTEREMDLLMSGSNGISWFYSWGGTPSTGVEVPARTRGLEFVPTQWSGANTSSINSIRTFIQNNPGTKYVMGYNEPNFPNQANMTPTQAANNWPLLRALANETGAKLTTPKMNYGSMMNPIAWLDEFRTRIGEEAWSEIQAINVHIYPWWPSAVKNELTQANGYRKYGKPIWLTEFCGWEDIQGWRTPTPELQAWYMSMTVLYLEMDPMVERYAWYLPKGHVSSNVVGVPSEWGAANNPYHNLLTEQPTGTTPAPELTDLGLIYTNMTTLDKTVWVPAGQRIDAAQFTNCNMEPFIGINGWQDTVLFWPTNDTDRSAGVLEIYDLRGTRWVEYQVNLPATRNYTMTVRYRTIETRSVSGAPVNTPQAVNTSLRTTVNGTRVPVGGAAADTTLNSATWTTATVNLGNLTAGNHTIRLQTNSGNCAINWLQID